MATRMSEMQELELAVPAELFSRFQGLAMDVGGSLMKFAYLHKDDKDACRVRLVSFPKRQLNEAIAFLQERVDIKRSDDAETPTTIYATGLGSPELATSICQAFNVRVEYFVSEFECNVRAFVYLAERLPRQELLEPFLADDVAEPVAQMLSLKRLFDWGAGMDFGPRIVMLTEGRTFWDAHRRILDRVASTTTAAAVGETVSLPQPPSAAAPLTEAEPDTFPCLTVSCGSTFAYTVIDSEGRYQLIDTFGSGGAAWLGIGNLIFGAKTFSELVELAERGDSRSVDKFSDFLPNCEEATGGDSNDVFHTIERSAASSYLIWAFGHAVDTNTDELKREDVARALLNYVVRDLVKTVQFLCQLRRIRRVYFYGGLCCHPFVRRTITAEFVYRMLCHRTMDEVDQYVDFDFVRPGTFLGALGCAINDIQHFFIKI